MNQAPEIPRTVPVPLSSNHLLAPVAGADKAPGIPSKGKGPAFAKIALGGAAALLAAAGITAYLVHASHYETTDDAYITGHVHDVSSRVAGTVVEVPIDDNQAVRRNDVLVRLDPRDFQINVDKAQADYDHASADFERVDELRGDGAISKQDYDQARNALRVAQASLDDANDQLGYCTVAAPTDGVVGNKTVQTGNRVAVGTILMSVVEDVWIVANYKETQVGAMRPGQRVRIHIDEIPGHDFDGWIDSLSPGSGSTFALLPPENATGNFTKIVQRVPVKIVFDPAGVRGYERQLVTGLSVVTRVDLVTPPRPEARLQASIPPGR